jgi:Dyp-type peroxidase family
MQNGFLPQVAGETSRNLFGQVDGTANPALGSSQLEELVWVRDDDEPGWMNGGTYLGLRRIRMSLTMWDRMGLSVQEAAVGRSRTTGAPLTGGDEFAEMDLDAKDASGALVIPVDAHARVAKISGPGMLRRGYSFDNGPRVPSSGDGSVVDPSTPVDHSSHSTMNHGQMAATMDDHDAGLMFVAFVRDPNSQFVAVQQALSTSDALGHFLSYTSASLWAVPGGSGSGSIAAGIYQ